jgi:sugar phosphate isomerase/epimerase
VPIKGFGCSAEDLRQLGRSLEAIVDAGFTHAELRPVNWSLWVNGRTDKAQVAHVRRVIEPLAGQLSFTLHAPYDLNLFDTDPCQPVLLRETIEVAAVLGAETVTLHPGRLERPSGNCSDPMQSMMARERDILLEVLAGVVWWRGRVALETWFASANVPYSYAVWPRQLVAQVEAINDARVGLCLDTGHVALSARWFGFALGPAVSLLSRHAVQTHVHENFGAMSTARASPELGRGDLHVPPGWGEPLCAAFSETCFARSPVFNVELTSRYMPHLEEILLHCRFLASLEQPVP